MITEPDFSWLYVGAARFVHCTVMCPCMDDHPDIVRLREYYLTDDEEDYGDD